MISVVRLRLYLGLLVVAVLGLVTAAASSATALPLYLGSIGNFQISADQIKGENFDLALAVDPNSGPTGGKLPVGEVGLGSARIDGLLLEKEFDLSAVLGNAAGGPWKLVIATKGATTLSGLRVNAAGICADAFDFGPGFAIDGKGAGTPGVEDDFSLGASTITLTKPHIEAAYLSTRQINLNDLRITVARGSYDLAPCARRR